MKKRTKWLLSIGITLLILGAIGFYPTSENLDPSKWIKITLRDTINAPLRAVSELVGNVKLEKATEKKKYTGMPGIIKIRPLIGNFSKPGDSHVIYFSSGDTLVESVVAIKTPYVFSYELTKPSLPMKYAVYKARGEFDRSALDSNRTLTVWTYSFLNRNLISKFFVRSYIKNTHQFWMRDMLKATKAQIEKDYQAKRKQDTSNKKAAL